MRLDGKIVLLTGASVGMGKEMALLFAKEGAKVVAVARRMEKLEELSKEASDFSGEVIALEGDVSKDEDIDHMVDFTMDKYGRIDVLVNNAGILDNFTPLGELSDELWDRVLNINLTAPMKLARKLIPIMEKQEKGNIINISSLGGLHGGRAGAAYSASKFGLTGLTIMSTLQPSEFGMERIMKGTANNIRSGSGKEIAYIALFLASDESSFISGDTIVADAGWSAY